MILQLDVNDQLIVAIVDVINSLLFIIYLMMFQDTLEDNWLFLKIKYSNFILHDDDDDAKNVIFRIIIDLL